MNAYPTAPLAWDRTRVMARTAGVDLVGAVLDGWLTRRELDGLVCACEACAQDQTCTDWQTGLAAQPDLPAFCSNKSDLESLRL